MALLKNKEPWNVVGVPWKTESSFWVWVRGILRKGWSRHPVKIEYIRLNRKKIKNPNVKSAKKFPLVWGMTCKICGVDHVQSNIEIDHKGDNATFTGLKDTESYVKHLYLVDFDSLQELCKPCHKIVSHAQNEGITFEQARTEKLIIEACKKNIAEQVAELAALGYNGCTNAEKRRAAYTKHFNNKEKQYVCTS